MNVVSSQIQIKVSLSEQLNALLLSKANKLGVPVTQFVKHLIIREVENEVYPTYEVSDQVEKNTQYALSNISKAVDASTFFNALNES